MSGGRFPPDLLPRVAALIGELACYPARDLVLRLNQKVHTADGGSPAIQRPALGSARERLNLLTVSVH